MLLNKYINVGISVDDAMLVYISVDDAMLVYL